VESVSEIKLLPCPFCGGEAILHHNGLTEKDHVTCLDCCCRTKDSITKEEAIKQWNTRKPMERIIERLKEKEKQRWLVLAERNGYERAIKIVKEEGGIDG
jgi:Lar family restriction alleviation protein